MHPLTLLTFLALTSPAAAGPGLTPELTLDAALAELDRQNLTLAQARSRAAEAEAAVRIATAPLIPTLGAQASYVRNDAGVSIAKPGTPPTALTIQAESAANVSGTLRVPLVVPTAWFDLASARATSRGAALSAEATRRIVRSSFAQAAHAAAAAEEVVAASERALADAEALARSAARRLEAGTAARLDLLRARTEAVKRQSDLSAARASLDRARLSLGVLLGRPAPVRVAVPATPEFTAAEADGADPASAALGRRAEIAAAAAQRDAAEARVRSAWARLAPQLSASATAFASTSPYVTGKEEGWRLSLDLSWALYDGGARYGARRQAEAQAAGAAQAAEAERLAVFQEVEDGLRELRVAGERYLYARSQAELAGEAAATARRSYDAGVASSLDVLDADDRRYAAETGLADARARLANARIALAQAEGLGS